MMSGRKNQEKQPGETSREDNPENGNEEKNISFYEGFDQFCEKEDIREADDAYERTDIGSSKNAG